MKNNMIFLLVILMVIFSCAKKTEDEPSGWTQEDQTFLDNIRLLQNEAVENYNVWSLSLDSLDVILQLQLRIPEPPMKADLLLSRVEQGVGEDSFLNPVFPPNSGLQPSGRIPILLTTGRYCTMMTLCTVIFQHG